MYGATMPRPGDSINEEIENKLDLTHSLASFELCETGSLFFRMNSLNNERNVVVEAVEAEESNLSGSDMETSDDEGQGLNLQGRTRRMALADIFENVNENDLMHLLSMYVKQEIEQMVNEKRLCRRGAKSDIFEGLSEEDVSGIVKHSCCDENCDIELVEDNETDSEYQTPCNDSGSLRKRRDAKCDIFEGLTVGQQNDIVKRFYEDYMERANDCDTKESNTSEVETNTDTCTTLKKDTISSHPDTRDTSCVSQSQRRGGKFYIFDGLSEEQRLHVISMCIETCCKDVVEPLQVAYGR